MQSLWSLCLRSLCLRSPRPGAATTAFGAISLAATPLQAGFDPAMVSSVLLAKSWMLGYALVFLCILLGLLAVLIPGMRKVLRRRD